MRRDLTFNSPQVPDSQFGNNEEDYLNIDFDNINNNNDETSQESRQHLSPPRHQQQQDPFADRSNFNSSDSIQFHMQPPMSRYNNSSNEQNSIYSESPVASQQHQFQPLLDHGDSTQSSLNHASSYDRYPTKKTKSIIHAMSQSSFDNTSNHSSYSQNSSSDFMLFDGDFS
ncbi:Beta-glucan synthesis-associated protein SKN1, partial [Candida maltosa Xu316]